MIHLEAIAFNHDTSSTTGDAFNVRKNFNVFLTVPEWQRQADRNQEDSVAAYAIRDTRGNPVSIQAKFSCSNPEIKTIEVRAIDPGKPASEQLLPSVSSWQALYVYGWSLDMYSQYVWYSNYLWEQAMALSGNILGEVKPRQITFQANGESRFETFALTNHRLSSSKIGIHYVTWRWQFRLRPGAPWQDLETTHHKIYTVLEVPKGPWQQFPYHPINTQLPWIDVLEYACDWARGCDGRDEAAGKITEAVNRLGPDRLKYGCEVLGAAQYVDLYFPYFDCDAFLERLRGGTGQGMYVNCTDCATIVSTFANILGCDLWQAQMGAGVVFQTFPILAIGRDEWQTPCELPGFPMHEVAWKWPCTESEEVFDACLHVDGGPNPTGSLHTPLLPVNMRFGFPGDGQYRDRLCTPQGRQTCVPSIRAGFSMPQKRLVTNDLQFEFPTVTMIASDIRTPGTESQSWNSLKERFDFPAWSDRNTLTEDLFIWKYQIRDEQVPGWQLRRMQQLVPPARDLMGLATADEIGLAYDPPRGVRSLWQPASGKRDRLLKVQMYECGSRGDAHKLLVYLLGQFELPAIAPRDQSIGDVAFADSKDRVILFARANLIFIVMSAGDRPISVSGIATNLDQDLVAKPKKSAGKQAVDLKRLAPLRIPRAEEIVPMGIVVPQLEPQPAMIKFFSQRGEVRKQRGQIVYRPDGQGKQEVATYTVTPDQGTVYRAVQIDTE